MNVPSLDTPLNPRSSSTRPSTLRYCFLFATAFVALAIAPDRAWAQGAQWSMVTLYTFSAGAGGGFAPSGLMQAGDGNLYGSAMEGGAGGSGILFRILPTGVFSAFHQFSAGDANSFNHDGAGPNEILQAGDGSFYGTASQGGTNGQGTIFQITTNGALTTLHSFSAVSVSGTNTEGASPNLLIQGGDGGFYGSTAAGGANGNGTLFRANNAGQISVLHTFSGNANSDLANPDGANPGWGLIQGSDGVLYGTAGVGGRAGQGTVFAMTTNGQFSTLHSFTLVNNSGINLDGAVPQCRLTQAGDGSLYGTTYQGGAHGEGTVFRITTNGQFTTLYSFSDVNLDTTTFWPNQAYTNRDGATPYAGLILGADGTLFGNTFAGGLHGAGTIFQITTNGQFTTLYSFSFGAPHLANPDGANPENNLVQDRAGNLYGTAIGGGANGYGAIFKLASPVSPPVIATQPVSQRGTAGGGANLTVSNTGSAPFSYQWQFNGTNIAGANNAALTLSNLSAVQAGGYAVVVTNLYGSTTSAVARLSFFGVGLSTTGAGPAPVLTLGDMAGSQYRIDATAELSAAPVWVPLVTNTISASPYNFIDAINPPVARRFYRAVLLP